MKSKMRILAAVMCCLLLLQMIPVGSAAEPRPFSDVPESAWYYESVSEAVERG